MFLHKVFKRLSSNIMSRCSNTLDIITSVTHSMEPSIKIPTNSTSKSFHTTKRAMNTSGTDPTKSCGPEKHRRKLVQIRHSGNAVFATNGVYATTTRHRRLIAVHAQQVDLLTMVPGGVIRIKPPLINSANWPVVLTGSNTTHFTRRRLPCLKRSLHKPKPVCFTRLPRNQSKVSSNQWQRRW